MNILKNFPTLQGLVKMGNARSGREYRAAMDDLVRPKTVYTGPTAKKLWSLKEQEEFYKNNTMYAKPLKVFHGYGSQENEVQIDKGEGFCYHDCTSRCGNDRECDCMCGPVHIPKN